MEKLISIKELFVGSFDIYKNKFLLMSALMVIPLLAAVAGGIVVLPFVAGMIFSDFNVILTAVTVLVGLVVFLAWLIINILSYISLFYCLKEDIQLNMQNIKNLFSRAWNMVGDYIWVAFLSGLIILLGFILLIIPGIIFAAWLCFSSFILIFEGVKGSKALKRSKELTKGYWFSIFGRLAVLVIAGLLVSMIPVVGDALSLLCVTPFGMIYMYLLYADLKKKKTAPINI